MKLRSKLKLSTGMILMGVAGLAVNNASAADKELLDILKSNGAITEKQYTELLNKGKESDEALKKMAWARRIKIKGDLRLRQEFVDINGKRDEDRQRYRARIGIDAKVTETVDASIRLASGSSDGSTSTNETMGDAYKKDSIWLDRAYLNWRPLAGVDIFGGKMKQPWEKAGDIIWDNDINPEGAAIKYSTKLGSTDLIASAGYLVLNDNDGLRFDEDSKVIYGQLNSKFNLGSAKASLGATVYDYSNENLVVGTIVDDGNDTTKFSLYELFGAVTLKTPIPVKLYGQYVKNSDADGINDGEDTAWLLGMSTKYDKWKFDYNYRDTELNAVSGEFNDSDFAGGETDSEGHKFKLGYKIDKNFGVGLTYYMAETNSLAETPNSDIDTLHIDLKAKF